MEITPDGDTSLARIQPRLFYSATTYSVAARACVGRNVPVLRLGRLALARPIMMADHIVSMENYKEMFDTTEFLKRYKCHTASEIPSRVQHMLRCFHKVFLTIPAGVKVLDYGAGPSLLTVISAAAKASEIILCEYTEKNRDALLQWLKRDPTAFDWNPHFSYVVQDLEGKGEQEVKERQEHVRKLVKAVVHCDITQDPPIDPDYNQRYDVVMTSLVIEGVATNHEGFRLLLGKLCKLIKPGGTILYYGVDNKLGYYPVGNYNFPGMDATAEFVLSAFEAAGFIDLQLDKFTHAGNPTKE